MYTQGLDQKGQPADKGEALESAENLAAFQERIDAEEKIEPTGMPCSSATARMRSATSPPPRASSRGAWSAPRS